MERVEGAAVRQRLDMYAAVFAGKSSRFDELTDGVTGCLTRAERKNLSGLLAERIVQGEIHFQSLFSLIG